MESSKDQTLNSKASGANAVCTWTLLEAYIGTPARPPNVTKISRIFGLGAEIVANRCDAMTLVKKKLTSSV